MALEYTDDRDNRYRDDIRSAVAALMREQSRDPYSAGQPDPRLTKPDATEPAATSDPAPARPRITSRWARAPRDKAEDLSALAVAEFEASEATPHRRRASRLAGPCSLAAADPPADGVAGAPGARRRPSLRHLGLLITLTVVFLYFWVFVGVLFFTIWGILGLWLMLGHDRVVAIGQWWIARKEQRAPGTEAMLRARAQRHVARIERVTSVLPAAWQDGIALPDFSESQMPESEPLDRLQRAV